MYKHILFILVTVLYCTTDANSEPIGKIVRYSGLVEYSPAISKPYSFADTSTLVSNSSHIRTSGQSVALIRLSSGSLLFLSERTRIRLEALPGKKANLFSIIVLSGAAYFSGAQDSGNITVHAFQTNTASIEAGVDAAFSVVTDTFSHYSSLIVVNGNPTVRSAGEKFRYVLRENNLAYIDAGTPIEKLIRITDSDLNRELEWINAFDKMFLAKEIEKARKRDETKRAIVNEKLNGTIYFCQFLDLSNYAGSWSIKSVIPVSSVTLLTNNNIPSQYIDIENYSRLPDSIDKANSVIVQGTINRFEFRRESRAINETSSYHIIFNADITYSIYSALNGRLITSFSKSIAEQQKEKEGETWQEITSLPFDINHPSFSKTVVGSGLKKIIQDLNKALLDKFGI